MKQAASNLSSGLIVPVATPIYGYYSQASRGKRRRRGLAPVRLAPGADPDASSAPLRRRWRHFIRKLYAGPLVCPRCGGVMRIIYK